MKKIEHKKRVVKAIRLAFDSLDSHLDVFIDAPKRKYEITGSRKFHTKAIREYSYIIDVLADCL